ncbi:MAG: hypothetical protein ACFFCS_10315 [Candidatus Hodarchaeota archaeon]
MTVKDNSAQNERVWISKLNFDEKLRESLHFSPPEKVHVRDSTIREGEETPGVHYTTDQKLEIVKVLEEIGIGHLDCGYVGVVEEQWELASEIKKEGLKMKTHCHLSSNPSKYPVEFEKIQEAGIDYLGFGLPLPEWQLNLFNLPPARKLLKIVPGIFNGIRKKTTCKIILDLVDAARTDLDLLLEAVEIGSDAGVDLINLYDTVGGLFPAAMGYLVRKVKEKAGTTPVGAHVHDDFGLATASSCASVVAGAEYLDLVVNKLGDRAGNASLEETVVSLELLYGVKTGIKLEKLYELSKLVEKYSDVQLPVNKPVVGFNTFLHESELHVMGAQKGDSWKCFTPFKPEIVGQEERIIFGPTTLHGDAIEIFAQAQGFDNLQVKELEAIKQELRKIINKRKFATSDELREVIKRLT